MSRQIVEIYWDMTIEMYRIRSPYDEDFKDAFKKDIPYRDRGWDGANKTWAFPESYLDGVLVLVKKFFSSSELKLTHRTEVEAEARKAAASLPSEEFTKNHRTMIAFVNNLDLESLGAAFKNRAKRLHPDAGGSSCAFSEFNAAYQELKKILEPIK